jgi:hypothetical protein
MKDVKVLARCCDGELLVKLVQDVARAKGVSVRVELVKDIGRIMGYGVMSSQGLVVDGKVVHSGGAPSVAQVEAWIPGA